MKPIEYAKDDARFTLEVAKVIAEVTPEENEDVEPLIAHGAGPAAPRRVRRGYWK